MSADPGSTTSDASFSINPPNIMSPSAKWGWGRTGIGGGGGWC